MARMRLLSELKACAWAKDLGGGRRAHAEAIEKQIESDTHVATALVNMYAKCGSLVEAAAVFQQHQQLVIVEQPPDRLKLLVVAWTALMVGFVQHKQPQAALDLFACNACSISPDARTYAVALKACAALGDEEAGVAIYAQAAKRGFHTDVFVSSTIMDLYAKRGKMHETRRVFESLPRRNAVSWTVLIRGYADNRENDLALSAFSRMQLLLLQPDSLIYVAAIKACSGIAAADDRRKQEALKTGMEIHKQAMSRSGGFDLMVGNTLVDMYSKCGEMVEAYRTFVRLPLHSVVSWTALMLGFVDSGKEEAALSLFERMRLAGVVPDALAIVAAIKACAAAAAKQKGRNNDRLLAIKGTAIEIHSAAAAASLSLLGDHRVGNTLVDMYAQCGSLSDARIAFDRITDPDIVSWNALLNAYTLCGDPETTLQLFVWLVNTTGIRPDEVTFIAALKACAATASLNSTRAIHSLIIRSSSGGGDDDQAGIMLNSLVDAYAKCGSMVDAQLVFDSLQRICSLSWGGLIAGYSRRAGTQLVFDLFAQMRQEGFQGDRVLFLSLLTACSHAGDVKRGESVFGAMASEIPRELEHYRCMIDLLGRSNQLEAAISLAESMPFADDVLTWRTVLGACCKWKNVVMARVAFERIVCLSSHSDDDDSGDDQAAYLLMENICSSLSLWEEQSQVKTRRIKACTMQLLNNNNVHTTAATTTTDHSASSPRS